MLFQIIDFGGQAAWHVGCDAFKHCDPFFQPGDLSSQPLILSAKQFDLALCGWVVGAAGDGWRVAMGLLGFERGISTLAQQIGFARELEHVIEYAQARGLARSPVMRQRLARAHTGLRLMTWTAMRSMGSGVPGPEASINKLFWGSWHRDLGELVSDVLGADSMIAEGFPYELTLEQKLFLFTRSDTIYGGSTEVQRNVIGERVLGLPKEPTS